MDVLALLLYGLGLFWGVLVLELFCGVFVLDMFREGLGGGGLFGVFRVMFGV